MKGLSILIAPPKTSSIPPNIGCSAPTTFSAKPSDVLLRWSLWGGSGGVPFARFREDRAALGVVCAGDLTARPLGSFLEPLPFEASHESSILSSCIEGITNSGSKLSLATYRGTRRRDFALVGAETKSPLVEFMSCALDSALLGPPSSGFPMSSSLSTTQESPS
jgi:hypothetical protein